MVESFTTKSRVYYVSPKTGGWLCGVVKSIGSDGKVSIVDEDDSNATFTVPSVQVHNIMEGAFNPNEPDLLSMSDLHPGTLMYCLKERYEKITLQYTRMSDMVISVNPFKPMPYNSESAMRQRVKNANSKILNEPHSWEIAHTAFARIIVNDRGNQSILISGESGAGKTETAKTIMTYLGLLAASHGGNSVQMELADEVNRKLQATNPILEAFGNAKTVRNDNSSRFGKYIKVYFLHQSGAIIGAQMESYLLEKSRVVAHGEGERNYHIFYYFLAGMSAKDKEKYAGVKTARDHNCTKQGGIFSYRGPDGKEADESIMLKEVVEAFTLLGMPPARQEAVWRIVAGIIHLQDVDFEEDPSTNLAKVSTPAQLTAAAKMFGLDPKEFEKTLLIRSVSKIMTNYCNKKEAEGLRDTVSKVLYNALFDWLVQAINAIITPTSITTLKTEDMRYIGILDIFGFEKFKFNSFEQLCINFANEGLQGHYNAYTFRNDAEECAREGISCPIVDYPDNQACIEMIEEKGGIMSILDEETNSKMGTDLTFKDRCWSKLGDKTFFVKPKSTTTPEIGVRHYAGEVLYNTIGWLSKNVNILKEDSKACFMKSTEESGLFLEIITPIEAIPIDGIARKKETVCGKFRTQLRSLLSELNSTESHFVRCIKPNPSATPGLAENAYIGAQLECAGVLQTITMKRAGYPVRTLISDFFLRYRLLCYRKDREKYYGSKASQNHKELARGLLQRYAFGCKWKVPHSDIGNQKVFLKSHVYDTLEKLLRLTARQHVRRCLPILKRWARGFLAKKAEEERRRKEELERMRLAAQKKSTTTDEARTIASKAGLPPEKAESFTKAATLFPHFDLPVILDVVYNLPTLESAVKALMSMQQDRVDGAVTDGLKQIYRELKLTSQQQEKLTVEGISSLDDLYALNRERMRSFDFDDTQINYLLGRMLTQRSRKVVDDKLNALYGTVNIDVLVQEVSSATREKLDGQCPVCGKLMPIPALPQHVEEHYGGGASSGMSIARPSIPNMSSSRGGNPENLTKAELELTKLGFTPEVIRATLASHNGDAKKAAEFLLDTL